MQKSEYTIFFDDGGVINDNEARGPQWRKLIAEFFIPKYGKTAEEWNEANIFYLEREIKFWDSLLDNKELYDMSEFLKRSHIKWVTEMLEYLKIPVPNSRKCIQITREAYAWIIPQVKSTFAGMNDLVKKLSQYFDLYTSSGTDYEMLKAYYKAQGIDNCFKKLYGSDLIGVFKSHPEYFEKLFKDSKVEPNYSIVIDDKEKVLDLANGFGAKCVLSNLSGDTIITGKYPVFKSPNELLKIISKITGVIV